MSTAISPCLVKIGLKTKIFYQYAKFWQDPFLNYDNSSTFIFTTFSETFQRTVELMLLSVNGETAAAERKITQFSNAHMAILALGMFIGMMCQMVHPHC